MNYLDLNKKLNQLKIEDMIWVIYIGIIILSWYANSLERNYFIYNDTNSKESYRNVMILIFVIATVVYLYFFKDSFEDLLTIPKDASQQKRFLTLLSFIGSTLILITGFIFLYIAIMDEELDVELAFN